MNTKVLTYISLSLLCGVGLLVQNWRPIDNGWTNKNNTERYAAYLLETTYYQQGYCAAKVEVKQDGSKRLFIVDPGEPFHLNVAVTGLHVFEVNKLMQDGPKTGEIFSPIRINDWAEQIRKNRPLSELEQLEHQLRRAVERQEFERAAQLRDRIRALKQQSAK